LAYPSAILPDKLHSMPANPLSALLMFLKIQYPAYSIIAPTFPFLQNTESSKIAGITGFYQYGSVFPFAA